MSDSKGSWRKETGEGHPHPRSPPRDSSKRKWLPTHPVLMADPGCEREDPAVLTLPHVEDKEGREASGVGATLPCSPPCQGDRHSGKESKVEYPKESRGSSVVLVSSIEGYAQKLINFTIAQCLAQDGAHVVVSIRKQQMNWAVAALQREGLGMTGFCLCLDGLRAFLSSLYTLPSRRIPDLLNTLTSLAKS
ncbi:hypothetical protein MJG53_008153 [Ovis ammon polii x Ovis aries]|uniref:Uncharacterized protein n=1 Tax=Ovis ammon polii x Ovis aries TaxID=2918886 RepID=A0ACB9V0C9_9CETA|nr:hypothetical protein MJG53_008153 [Ovis ammon polii x Ovis aries]